MSLYYFLEINIMVCVLCLTVKLQHSYRYHNFRTFSKFYRRHYEYISKFNVGLKTLLRKGINRKEKVQVGNDKEIAQSESDSHSK